MRINEVYLVDWGVLPCFKDSHTDRGHPKTYRNSAHMLFRQKANPSIIVSGE